MLKGVLKWSGAVPRARLMTIGNRHVRINTAATHIQSNFARLEHLFHFIGAVSVLWHSPALSPSLHMPPRIPFMCRPGVVAADWRSWAPRVVIDPYTINEVESVGAG